MLWGLPATEDEERELNEKCTFGTGEAVATNSSNTNNSTNAFTGVAGVNNKYLRYATYRLDRSIQQNILFMSRQTDCTDPDSEDWNCPPESGFFSQSETSVASFNLNWRGFDNDHPEHKWEDRRDAIKSIVASAGVDILATQEIFDSGMYDDVRAMFPDYGMTSDGRGVRRNTILYKKAFYTLESEGSKDLGSNRNMTWAKLNTISNGQKILVVDIHLEVDNFCLATDQADIVIDEIKSINSEGLPIVVLGDFNSRYDETNSNCSNDVSAPRKFVNDGFTYTKNAALSKINEEYATFNGYQLPMRKGNHIDYILVKGSSSPITVNQFSVNIDTPGGVIASDHNAIIARIQLSNASIDNNSSQFVNTDGYAWPVDIYKNNVASNQEENTDIWTCNTRSTCHYDGSPYAIDLVDYRTKAGKGDSYTVGKSVFAIKDGTMNLVKNVDAPGCYSFHIVADDGHDYFYVHTRNPIIGSGNSRKVKAGEKVAEIGERKCTGNGSWPHLHIDRARKGEINYGTSSRDPSFDDFIVALHNGLTR
jgi:endonuclease/exonuclease/phosphatase family metal-dependent hydrolase